MAHNALTCTLIFFLKSRLHLKSTFAISVLFLLINVSVAAGVTYYSTNLTAADVTTNWHVNRNGSGASPTNFKNDDDIFVVQAGHYLTTTSNWLIKGANATLIIESGATLKADDKVTVDILQIYSAGTYIHNASNNNFPGTNTRTLASDSNVEIWNWSGSAALPDPTVWGNLTLNVNSSYNSNWNMSGKLTDIVGNFRIISTGDPSKELRLATNQDYTLNIGGDFIIEGGQIDAANNNAVVDQAIIINGSFTQTGGTFTRSNNKSPALSIQFNGADSYFTASGGTLTSTYIDWIVNTSKKLTLNNNFSISTGRSFLVNGTLVVGTKLVNGLGAFTLSSTGTISTSHTSGLNGSLTITGLLTLTNGGSYEFHAATSIPFLTISGTISATNLVVDANVTINKDINVAGTLTLTSGKLTIPTGNTINITSGNAISGSGFSNSKHIVTQVNSSSGAKGILRMGNFTGTKTFPIGNGTYYLPVLLSVSGTNDFSMYVFQGATTNGAPNGTAFSNAIKLTMVDAIWNVSRNSGSGSATLQLSWQNALEGSTFSTYSNAAIGISHYGGSWDLASGSGDQVANTAARNAISSFSPFYVGESGIPLSLTFGDIKGYLNNTGIQIDWTSLTEINVDHYEIERSKDQQQFSTVAHEVATGNNALKNNYSWYDSDPLSETSFYRIKAVEKDGKNVYSKIIAITPTIFINKAVLLYPNPVADNRITLEVKNINAGQYRFLVSDINGRFVYSRSFDHQGGVFKEAIQLPLQLTHGIYNMTLSGGNIKVSKTFVVQ